MNASVSCRLARAQQSRRIMASASAHRSRRAPESHSSPVQQARAHSVESVATSTSTLQDMPMFPESMSAMNHFPDQSSARRTPQAQYKRLVRSGTLHDDPHQQEVVHKLQALHDRLETYEPGQPTQNSRNPQSSSLLSRLFSVSATESSPAFAKDIPRSLYLYGDVGTGKSMLMDLFYDTLPPRVHWKRRVHFHAFMIDVHKRVHAVKRALGASGGDPLLPVARDLAREANVLCFDEFQVTDIADAMILRRLIEYLMDHGVVFVMTSNRHPDELYMNGIQRSSFIPCIELFKSKFDVINLDSGTDYRRIPRALSNVYFHPLSRENKHEMNKLFRAIATKDGEEILHDRQLNIWGRTLRVPESTSKVAKISFYDLCGKPLSAADYLELTRTFRTLFVTDVPKMNLNYKDMARRFITFIDSCYESKTKLFISSEVPIYQAFSDEPDSDGNFADDQRKLMDDLGLSESVVGTSTMFSGEEEIFAFARCCSRLVQMGSREWAETAGPD